LGDGRETVNRRAAVTKSGLRFTTLNPSKVSETNFQPLTFNDVLNFHYMAAVTKMNYCL